MITKEFKILIIWRNKKIFLHKENYKSHENFIGRPKKYKLYCGNGFIITPKGYLRLTSSSRDGHCSSNFLRVAVPDLQLVTGMRLLSSVIRELSRIKTFLKFINCLYASWRTPSDSIKHPPRVKCGQTQQAGKISREGFCADSLLCCLSVFLLIRTCIMKPIKA
jgi:hypothetical protein